MHGVARRVAELTLEPRFLLALQPPQYFNVNFVELSNLARGPQLTVLPNHFDDDATVAHGLGQFEPADAKLLKPLLMVERLAPTVLSPRFLILSPRFLVFLILSPRFLVFLILTQG